MYIRCQQNIKLCVKYKRKKHKMSKETQADKKSLMPSKYNRGIFFIIGTSLALLCFIIASMHSQIAEFFTFSIASEASNIRSNQTDTENDRLAKFKEKI